MEFQLSVFHQGGYISYQITSDDSKTFHFLLISAPPDKRAPEAFMARRDEEQEWLFEPALQKDFEEDVAAVLKRAKV